MSPTRSKLHLVRRWVVRHLFVYLAVVSAFVVAVGAVLARDELRDSLSRFDMNWILPVLGLSLINYGFRFAKWERLLRDSHIRIPRLMSFRIYFACLSMVVTPARLGELYKIVFLRRLFGVSTERSLPPMVIERVTDVMALTSLSLVIFVDDWRWATAVVLASVVAWTLLGTIAAHPRSRIPLLWLVSRIGPLRTRRTQIETTLQGHASLLIPSSLTVSISLSVLAWWAECLGLRWICVGLAEPIGAVGATWIYALGTLIGNLTFLPGGLGGTEAALMTFLQRVEVSGTTAIAATALIRVATLWFAVALGLVVTLASRRALHWDDATREAAGDDQDEGTE